MDYKELKEFIKAVSKSGVSEVDIKTDEMKLSIKVTPPEGEKVKHTETVIQQVPVHTSAPMMQQPVTNAPVNQAGNNEEAAKKEEKDDEANLIPIKSPMVGTFYRKPAPEKPSFVNVGDNVNEETVVCIIEAMKLFNEIEAEVSGKIVKVLVDDATPVEFDQALFLVEPN